MIETFSLDNIIVDDDSSIRFEISQFSYLRKY